MDGRDSGCTRVDPVEKQDRIVRARGRKRQCVEVITKERHVKAVKSNVKAIRCHTEPHLPLRLPCYNFTSVTSPTFGIPLFAVKIMTSSMANSHNVMGGVYKAREQIHHRSTPPPPFTASHASPPPPFTSPPPPPPPPPTTTFNPSSSHQLKNPSSWREWWE
ncbi:hypothetical protein QJS04_geneDACA025069 [Acorus gramineus]|uniref:Uncharacterized protein n=1 Tax=Acorus gramineus TaxID=55184 RepID=A0AAV8ZZU2_ACOGR|nr:hypothetical protein QJS04_geneDACA025069 [Acorus gramineus]